MFLKMFFTLSCNVVDRLLAVIVSITEVIKKGVTNFKARSCLIS